MVRCRVYEQVLRLATKCDCEALKDSKAEIAPSALNGGDVGPVQVGGIRELRLREPQRASARLDLPPDDPRK
jgi:hypothetical protein